ncbi:MAG: hypothetical protein AB1608_00535 [Thermoproteota archaeon]
MPHISQNQALLAAMVAVAVMFLLANYFQEDKHPIIEDSLYYTDIFFIVVSPLAIVFGTVLARRHGTTGSHSIAWILFLAGSVVWYAADLTYYVNAEYAVEDNDTYLVDFLYYSSYFLYFGFMIFYLKPRKSMISKKLIIAGSIISIGFIIPSLYFLSQKQDQNTETTINLVYPFLDSMIFIPAFIALVLFFRGAVNFLWVTVTLGTIFIAVADTTFLIERCLGIFSASSIANLFFAWKWLLFIFGAYSHIRIFGTTEDRLRP